MQASEAANPSADQSNIGDALSFEQALIQLEAIVRRMETGEAGLEESVDLFKQGTKLSLACDAYLKQAETVIEQLVESPTGEITLKPFSVE